jgi:hypothetical protein
MNRKPTCVLLALLALVAASSAARAQAILAPNVHYHGLTYGQWAATWWQAVIAIPIVGGDHPLISGGAVQGPEGVVFLTGVTIVDEPAVVEITIPAGTPLFFPVVNASCSLFEPDPFHGDDEVEMRACANDHIDHTSGRFAMIDGWPVSNLDAYRCESPLFVWGPLPANNLFAAPEGTVSPAVDAGFYLLLAPLSVGEHVIEFGGTYDELAVSTHTRYIITVVPMGP